MDSQIQWTLYDSLLEAVKATAQQAGCCGHTRRLIKIWLKPTSHLKAIHISRTKTDYPIVLMLRNKQLLFTHFMAVLSSPSDITHKVAWNYFGKSFWPSLPFLCTKHGEEIRPVISSINNLPWVTLPDLPKGKSLSTISYGWSEKVQKAFKWLKPTHRKWFASWNYPALQCLQLYSETYFNRTINSSEIF